MADGSMAPRSTSFWPGKPSQRLTFPPETTISRMKNAMFVTSSVVVTMPGLPSTNRARIRGPWTLRRPSATHSGHW